MVPWLSNNEKSRLYFYVPQANGFFRVLLFHAIVV